jgi:capsid assembly protease
VTPAVEGTIWAVERETLRLLANGHLAYGVRRAAAAQRNHVQPGGGVVSIIPVHGVITHRESLRQQILGGTSIERLTATFRQCLGDASIRAIVLDVDSPGGEVAGTPELASEIFRSRHRKKIVAVANGSALAGAFWLASMAGELVVTPSGQVGSIGIYATHVDQSKALEQDGVRVTFIKAGKFKTDGNPYEPLSESGRAGIQNDVDAFYSMFVRDVARGRGISSSTVRDGYGQGRAVLAEQALAMGMADLVGTLDQTIARLVAGREKDSAITPGARQVAGVDRRRRELELLSRSREPRGLDRRRRELELVSRSREPRGLERRRRELDLLRAS